MRFQYVEAMKPVRELHDVGDFTAACFKEAGMETVVSIKHNKHAHRDLQLAIDRMKLTIDKPDAVWRRQGTRLDDVVRRIQHPTGDWYVPAAFMCPISTSWYEVRHSNGCTVCDIWSATPDILSYAGPGSVHHHRRYLLPCFHHRGD